MSSQWLPERSSTTRPTQARSAQKEMQAAIDAEPAKFRALAQALSASMDQVVAAAKAKDAAKLFDVSGGLDQVCESCHMQFWYPEQKAPR